MPKLTFDSCGALFYSIDSQGRRGVILGKEGSHYFVFKGCPSKEEEKHYGANPSTLYKVAASREIFEESCGLINIDYRELNLEHLFCKRSDGYIKRYHIGLIYVPYNFVAEFKLKRSQCNLNKSFREKTQVKFFELEESLRSNEVAEITKRSIIFYKDRMQKAKIMSKGPVIVPPAKNVLKTVYDIITCSTPVGKIIELLSPTPSESDYKSFESRIGKKMLDLLDSPINRVNLTPANSTPANPVDFENIPKFAAKTVDSTATMLKTFEKFEQKVNPIRPEPIRISTQVEKQRIPETVDQKHQTNDKKLDQRIDLLSLFANLLT